MVGQGYAPPTQIFELSFEFWFVLFSIAQSSILFTLIFSRNSALHPILSGVFSSCPFTTSQIFDHLQIDYCWAAISRDRLSLSFGIMSLSQIVEPGLFEVDSLNFDDFLESSLARTPLIRWFGFFLSLSFVVEKRVAYLESLLPAQASLIRRFGFFLTLPSVVEERVACF